MKSRELYTCDRCGVEHENGEGNVARFSSFRWVVLYLRPRVFVGKANLTASGGQNHGNVVEPDLCTDCEESLKEWWSAGN